ncbi:SAV_915 family protein [Streptomyces sp. NPDC052396]|uniref:SAV_915 family protein n=1 Tax=Streptomyces sp. NPDC052396 TaxID=3365689 RepID=UPI0037D6C560
MSRTPAEAAAVAAVNSPQAEAGEPAGEPSHPVRHPSGPAPALFVPVRHCPSGFALRAFRSSLGERTAVAFTSARLLTDCLGPRQAAVRLSLPALRALAAPLGITEVRVDPQLTAPPVQPPAADSPAALLPTFPG